MAKAIIDVLPNTTHKLCLWHLLQKVPEHLAHVYNKYPEFQHEFNHCIHETLTIEKFELEWTDMLLKYKLEENSWLQNFYSRRSKWVPAYLRNTFCAGMSTTQRSESINKFFKDYVRSSMMVSEFVHQYDKALNTRYLSEKEKDVKTKTSKPIMRTSYSIEEEAAKIYTRKSFLIFQDDLFNSQRFKAYKTHEEDGRKIYWVGIAEKEKPAYEVTLGRENNTVSCTCCKFEFIGFLCQHSLHVLAKKSILDTVMQSYILERWTMNAKSRVVDGICVDEGPLEIVPSSLVMKHRLMR
ncbi:protein FAR1-RELATED SEQUENCE 5-like [Carya illinoinensis]|uniref:protein FAR1-RELATED SEQUENCE 5-like n=1 Tax=Carya illinoinensis TaxID=32201 RepID=UPI001C724BF8|nr:protein FAR1-RELATED SEQUENCE 5-like [Carya illinoinensis]